jgi:rubrerythrin
MNKHVIIPVLAALFAINFLTSCSNNPESSAKLQEPSAQAGSPASTQGEIKGGEEDEMNEAAEKEGKQGGGATAGTASTVISNLSDAFTGETTASAKYAAYSKKAQEEGFPQIAMLFKAASTSENIHANNHRAVLEDMGVIIPVVKPTFSVKTTQENLQDAIAGESYEIATMYPGFLANAKTSGNQLASISLNYAFKTEQKHKVLYDKALAALQSNQVKTLSMQYYVCPTCGNTYDQTPPKRCGISMTNSEKFITIAKA